MDLREAGVGELGFGALEERAHELRPCFRGALRDRTTLRLSGGHADGVEATRSHEDAIAATTCS